MTVSPPAVLVLSITSSESRIMALYLVIEGMLIEEVGTDKATRDKTWIHCDNTDALTILTGI